jgi:hypothetical protein
MLISLFLERVLEVLAKKLISFWNHSGNLFLTLINISDTSCFLGYSIATSFKEAFKDNSTHS